jgi:hypothetical protein
MGAPAPLVVGEIRRISNAKMLSAKAPNDKRGRRAATEFLP